MRQIIKQPDGRYSIYSTIVENFIYTDLTAEEYIQIRIAEESADIRETITDIIGAIGRGEKPYHQFTKTYDEAVKFIKQRWESDE